MLKVIGLCYGILGIINFFTAFLLFAYGPPLNSMPMTFTIEALGTPLLISLVSFGIMYSFFKLKKWGRYLAIIFNSVGILILGSGFKWNPPVTTLTIFYLLIFIVLPIGTILFCFDPKVKDLMQN